MSANIAREPGDPEVLTIDSAYPVPVPQPGEVLIQVAAAGLNRADILQRQGKYNVPKGASPLIGLEVSGIIATPGDKFQIGEKVVALCNGGGYAEYVAVPEGQVLPLPENYTLIEGAVLPETYFTVQQTIFGKAGLTSGMTVLIHGGSGGIGGTAIQMAALAGARVITTVSDDAKAAYATKMGASATINYKTEDFVARVLELTDNLGADIILDVVGGDYLNRNLKAIAENGTIIQLALQAGAKAQITLAQLVVRGATLIGTRLRPVSDTGKAAIAQQLLKTVWPALNAGKLHKQRLTQFMFDDAQKAHEEMDSPNHIGKVVLVTSFGAEETAHQN